MRPVKVENQSVNVSSGQVGLTKAQASVRMHALQIVGKPDKEGRAVYNVIAPINFKVGEVFGFSGDLSKGGQLRDREAEELGKLEAADRAVAQIRAEYEAKLEAARQATAKAVEDALAAERVQHAAAVDKAVAEALAKAAGK